MEISLENLRHYENTVLDVYMKHYFDSSISPIIINQPINRRQ